MKKAIYLKQIKQNTVALLTPRYNTVIQDYKKFSYQRKLL